MPDRLHELARWGAASLPMRCMRRFSLIEGRNRSMIIAGQAFTTVIPLLILTAGITGRARSGGMADGIVARFHLSGESASAMRTLFTRPPASTGAISVVGLVVLLAALLSLTRSLQRTYEEAWRLRPLGVPGALHGLSAMSLLVIQVIMLTLLGSLLRGVSGAPVLTPAVRLLALIPLWWLLQYLLLSRRVPPRKLLPGAVIAAAGQVVVMVSSAYWMPRVVATDAERYGVIGVTFALISWLIIIALAIVLAAVVGAELAEDQAGALDSPADEVRVP